MLTSTDESILQSLARELAPNSPKQANRKAAKRKTENCSFENRTGILMTEWLMMAAAFLIGSGLMESLLK